MDLTRIAALPGSGAGLVAAWRLEDDPRPPTVRQQAPPPRPTSMAHVDIDPYVIRQRTKAKAKAPKNEPWFASNPWTPDPPPPQAQGQELWGQYLVQDAAGVHAHGIHDPGHSHGIMRDPGKSEYARLGRVELRVPRDVAMALKQAHPSEVLAIFQDECSKMAEQQLANIALAARAAEMNCQGNAMAQLAALAQQCPTGPRHAKVDVTASPLF